MKVYNFKCDSCGAVSSKKVDKNIYRCNYCGSEKIIQKNTSEEISDIKEELKDRLNNFNENLKQPKTKKTLICLLVCFFFGMFGIHRFVEGKIFSGLLYLFTGGLFGIGVFVDIVKYLFRLCNINAHENRGKIDEK